MKKTKKNIIPDITEFTDDEGKKWVQTSTDDFFSLKELNDILDSVEKEKESGEVVLARINFQKVNREYYDAAISLQSKLNKQTELLKKVITESKKTIVRKNAKLKELIAYIRKLHQLIAYLTAEGEGAEKISIPAAVFTAPEATGAEAESEYEEVEEVVVAPD
jgi:tRNA pseudouridine-54 N-methylase